MQAQQYMEEELANEIEYKVSEAPIIDAAMQSLTRDQNYARSTTIVSEPEDLYDDVIKAVNGVQITNLSDATNAVNSMMSGTRFDVTLERSNKPLELKYQVK